MESKGITAYIGIHVQRGWFQQVHDEVKAIPGIVMSNLILGPCDIMLKVEEKDLEGLRKIIARVGKTSGVLKTVTSLVVEKTEPKGLEVGAYVFVTAQPAARPEVIIGLYKYKGINMVSLVLGDYDFICEVEAKNLQDVYETIKYVHGIPEIFGSSTFLVIKPYTL